MAKLFNKNYINIAERPNGLKSEKIVCHKEDFDKRIVLHNIIKKYENYSGIIKIKNNMFVKSPLSPNDTLPSARQITSNEVNKLKFLNTKKVSGTDKIPAKLVKLASNFLSPPLAMAINDSLASSKFLDIAEIATIVPIDIKTDSKYDVSNFSTCKFMKLLLKCL